MFGKTKALQASLEAAQTELQSLRGLLAALDHAMARVEFAPDGTILSANGNFGSVMGYSQDELRGMPHRRLCQPSYAGSTEYQAFWERLRQGQSISGKFQRVSKSGEAVWLEASYFPVPDQHGKIVKVIKVALDITKAVRDAAYKQSLVDAINRSMAVIEFDMQGNVLDANQNFLDAMGYTLADIKGAHHKKFCKPEYAQSEEYQVFWKRLNNGEFFSGQFERVTRGGDPVWLEATYNPVLDENGKPCRVIKFASNISERVMRHQAEQRAASTAYQVSLETEGISSSGEEIILQAIGKMKMLANLVGESSRQVESLGERTNLITSIVNTIREIADQTNLLALNAAIEAARAGESGRGFAVVADEVRKLAERTANSTAEISEMITNIQSESRNVIGSMGQSLAEVEEGVRLANEAGEAIHQIRAGAQKVVSVVQEFSSTIRQSG